MFRRVGLGVVLLLILGAIVLSTRVLDASGRAAPAPSVLNSAPGPTSTFLAAYARGDLAEADTQASPLYRAEWTRRGLSLADRKALLPSYLNEAGHAGVWIQFSYIGGMVDDRGFGHLLYVARATGGDGSNAPTAWRVDTDQSGRVIWIEMVGLFTQSNATLTTIAPTGDLSAIPLTPTDHQPQPCIALGVRNSAGPEGYYAVGIGANSCPDRVEFFAVDEDGQIRPGAWTFGQNEPGLVTYGHIGSRPTIPLPTVEDNLRSAYLASLP